MAALQSIRSHGKLLVTVVAIALFVFVIEGFLGGIDSIFGSSRTKAGEVAGATVDYQDFQNYLNKYQYFVELTGQRDQVSDEQINDAAWNAYVQKGIISKECEELGLAVSDEEVAEAVRMGQSQFLQIAPFMDQRTGGFSYAAVQQFITSYDQAKSQGQALPEEYEKLYQFYMFAQEEIRSQILTTKYQALLMKSFLSNPVEAKMAFEDHANESDIVLVSVPFTSVSDDAVKVSDEDIQAKYDELKERLVQPVETRSIKFIDVPVVASNEDKVAMDKEMKEYAAQLDAAASNDDAAAIVRKSNSAYAFSDVLKKADAYPEFIASQLNGDSTAVQVGQTVAATYDARNNAFYTFKLLEKTAQADSVLIRAIQIIGKDEADIETKADSVVKAVSAGANFKEIAKKYNQGGDSTWIATAAYQNGVMDADSKLQISTIYGMSKGETKSVKFSNGATLVIQVMDTRNTITKYNVAAIIKELKYSSDTYNKEYNKFSSFVAENTTLEQMEKNAVKSGYAVQTADITCYQHRINNIAKTNDAIKWAFDEAKEKQLSALYECGESEYGHLLLVALEGVNKPGYIALDKVKDNIKALAMNDKKAEKLLETCKNVKDLASAKAVAGAIIDSVSHVSFAAPAYIPSMPGSNEPIVSALASKTAKGAFSKAVKGNNGVYMLQVVNKNKTADKYDAKAEQAQLASSYASYVFRNLYSGYSGTLNMMGDLYIKAGVKDLRYKFF